MNTKTITIDLPSDILLSLNENESELVRDIKISLAVRLYTLQKLSIGKAAELSGLSHLDFETLLSESGISISTLTIEDVMNDSRKLL